MIAAHHIALLLLSTASVGSREHGEIIEQNGPGVWIALGDLQLVERESDQALWQLTERGRILVDHVLSLPLPVLAWRMPVQQQPVMPPHQPQFDIRLMRAGPIGFVPAEPVEDPPQPPAPLSMLPKVDIPTDPAELESQANMLLNRGYGLNEVAQMLKLSPTQAKAIFGAT